MPYYTHKEFENIGFKHLGENVKVSIKASVYDPEKMAMADNSRVDDFCVLSGKVSIGRNVHITPMCSVAGGEEGIVFEDFTTIAYGVLLKRHTIVVVVEDAAIGAMSLVTKSTELWGIHVSTPAVSLKERSSRLLALEKNHQNEGCE